MTHSERVPEVDLHGLSPQNAMRRLGQALHAARVRGAAEVRVITGKGWGNRLQEPKLRNSTEAWLRGPEGQRLGVLEARPSKDGGALLVRLRR